MVDEKNIKSLDLHHLGIVASTIDELKFIEKIDEKMPLNPLKSKTTMGERVSAMILNGLGFINNRLYIFPKFLENKPIDRLIRSSLKSEDFNDDALGRCLDEIYNYGTTKFFSEIAFTLAIENKLLGKSINVDSTAFSLYGAYIYVPTDGTEAEVPPLPKYGYAKNKRDDLKVTG